MIRYSSLGLGLGVVLLVLGTGCASKTDAAGAGGMPPGTAGTSSHGGSASEEGGAGSTPTAGGGGRTPVDVAARDKQLERSIKASCELGERCYPGFVKMQYGTVSECIERVVEASKWEANLPGTAALDASWYSGCADFWTSATCDDYFAPESSPACTFKGGTMALGEPCNDAFECSSGFCKQSGWSCGQCAAVPATGAACALDSDCGAGTWCMPSKKCQPPANLGESCSDQLYCRGGLNCTNGTCVEPPGTVGAACNTTDSRCSLFKELLCNASSKCVKAEPVDPGAACVFPQYCSQRALCTDKVCAAGPGDGGACDPSAFKNCEWPALCVDGACQLPSSELNCK